MIKVTTLVLTAATIALNCAASSAEQLPKSGSIQFHTGWKWTGDGMTVADKHMMGHGAAIGTTFNDKGSGPLHLGPADCFGTFFSVDAHAKNKGFCAFGDADGDRIFTEYTGTDGEQGINEIVGGTGKYAGIKGSGPWKCKGSGANGELQCAQRLDYKLP